MNATNRLLSIAVVGLLCAVVTAFLLSPAAPSTTGRDEAAEAYMYTLVDEARAEQGLGPLRPADDVADVAAAWSAEMASTRHFVHNPRHADEICCWTQVAENIAWSDPPRTRLLGDPVATVVEELHEALLASPGHRENLLHTGLEEIGVGIHVERDGSVWITQNFRTAAR